MIKLTIILCVPKPCLEFSALIFYLKLSGFYHLRLFNLTTWKLQKSCSKLIKSLAELNVIIHSQVPGKDCETTLKIRLFSESESFTVLNASKYTLGCRNCLIRLSTITYLEIF